MNNIKKFEPYTAFKLLVLLCTVMNDKFVISETQKSNQLGIFLTNSIADDLIQFSAGTLKSNDNNELIVSDKETAKNDIANFITNYGFNYDILKDDFLKNLDISQAPKFYQITDYKYVPFVLMEYAKNKDFVKSIQVSINDMQLFSEHSYSIKELLPFEIIVDISTLLDSIAKNKSKSSNLKKERTKNYSDTQEKIYLYLKKWVKEYNSFGIDYYSLRNYVKRFTSDVSKALCELNKKFQVINNTKEKLIKFDRGLDQYLINKAIV